VDAETLKDDSPNSAEDSTELIDAVSAIATVTAERDQLAAEKAEFQDRFLRSQAEFQNLRRRLEKELIFQRLFDTLKKLGLEPIDSQGQPFDPHVHHAVEKQETEEVSADTVLEEYQRGYNFKGQLLRPAMVKVAVAPASKSE
jgi:molecular chaperone GrpE